MRYFHDRPLRPVALDARRWDDRILAYVMLGLSVPRVVLAVVTGEQFGAEPSIAAVVASLGLVLLATSRR
jgi:hypothetical protein